MAGHVPKLLDRFSIRYNVMGRYPDYKKVRGFTVGWAFLVDTYVGLFDIHYHWTLKV